MQYDRIAGHALLAVVIYSEFAMKRTIKVLEQRRHQSASFLSQLPLHIDKSRQSLDTNVDLIMDQIFHDPLCKLETSVVEHVIQPGKNYRKNNDKFFLPVALQVSLDDLCHHLISNSAPENKNGDPPEDEILRSSANSAVAHIQLGTIAKAICLCFTS
jgi:hypothetical protein